MGRDLMVEAQLNREIEEALLFDLIYWWQRSYPDSPLYELADWWDQSRNTRTDEEFSRLLSQILNQEHTFAFSGQLDRHHALFSAELQHRMELGVLKRIATL